MLQRYEATKTQKIYRPSRVYRTRQLAPYRHKPSPRSVPKHPYRAFNIRPMKPAATTATTGGNANVTNRSAVIGSCWKRNST